jgi:hypothetical protein
VAFPSDFDICARWRRTASLFKVLD